MSQQGGAALSCTGRYMLAPVTLALLADVLRSAPGADGAGIEIDLAPHDGARGLPEVPKVFHGHADDRDRVSFLAALLPHTKIRLAAPKTDLPHRRQRTIRLKDGRRYRDQGFGGWKHTGGDRRHGFHRPPKAQARENARHRRRGRRRADRAGNLRAGMIRQS